MEYYFAWWNLENLFDLHDSAERPDWLQRKLNHELSGWNADVLDIKLDQLAQIIKRMNNGSGPDLLGVCEVEGRAVLDKLLHKLDLPGRKYAVVHSDTGDGRGIDVAFIYDLKLFRKPYKSHVFNHVVLKRNATRDILQVNFKIRGGQPIDFVVIGNHWPSKLGGDLASEPYRMMAAETLSYWLERIPEKFAKEVPVVVMGDFNDEPFNRSITDYALALKDSSKVRSRRTRRPLLFNLMWEIQEDGIGSHYYNDWSMLDQMMVNRALLEGSGGLSLVTSSCGIYRDEDMLKRGKPKRFGRPSSRSFDIEGYSDHLPIFMRISKL
jgi:endonuclease/exonuclease/phosphatase family metal-dependent hydrolase